jgi:chemotaxis protein MotB
VSGGKVIIIKKKGKHRAAHHGGAWKVAYADFVTALMALFIVLWLLSQTDQATKQTLSEYFRTGVFTGAASVVSGGSGITDKGFLDVGPKAIKAEEQRLGMTALMVREALEKASKNSAAFERLSKQVSVQVTSEGLLIQIMDGADDVFFDLSSAELKPELRKILETIAPVLAKLDHKLQIHGHTDSRPFPEGSRRTNWQLSFERADNTRVVLQENGIPATKIAGVYAYADTILKVPENPRADANRRLAILAVRSTPLPSPSDGVSSTAQTPAQSLVRPTAETVSSTLKDPPTPL